MQFDTVYKHGYLSTACFHGLHAECREDCKFCQAPCLCQCHWIANPREVARRIREHMKR